MSNHTPDEPNLENGPTPPSKKGIRAGLRNLKRRLLGEDAFHGHDDDRVRFEPLEPRLLYSASPIEVPADVDMEQHEQLAIHEAPANIPSDASLEASNLVETAVLEAEQGSDLRPESFVDADQLKTLANAAAQRWAESGLSEEQLEVLSALRYRVEDLGAEVLAESSEYEIRIDVDGAETGWFLDGTPLTDAEFTLEGNRLVADQGSAAGEGYDLLSLLLQEQGRVLGVADSLGAQTEVRAGSFDLGERIVPAQLRAQGGVADAPASSGLLAGPADSLSLSELEALAEAAAHYWAETGLDEDQLAALEQVSYRIEDLSGNVLGQSRKFEVVIDADAAGYGWYLDETPYDHSEFGATGPDGVDLLTVLMHEQGHVLGLDDLPASADRTYLMVGFFGLG